jgi:transposase InsO family protein
MGHQLLEVPNLEFSGTQVRNGLYGGRRRIRTLGPPSLVAWLLRLVKSREVGADAGGVDAKIAAPMARRGAHVDATSRVRLGDPNDDVVGESPSKSFARSPRCDYCDILLAAAIIQSMSRKGNCWDNAPMESFRSKPRPATEPLVPAARRGASSLAQFGFQRRPGGACQSLAGRRIGWSIPRWGKQWCKRGSRRPSRRPTMSRFGRSDCSNRF